MAKSIGKYFVAIVPESDIQQDAINLKLLLKENFNLKYALKSPAHVTLKMPFNWNEAKEDKLIGLLKSFFEKIEPFEVRYSGFDRFGNRVIFVKIKEEPTLYSIQNSLSEYFKRELKLVVELSDKAYHPHLTLAFKDIKTTQFDTYWSFIKKQTFDASETIRTVALLKRKEGRWEVLKRFEMLGIEDSKT